MIFFFGIEIAFIILWIELKFLMDYNLMICSTKLFKEDVITEKHSVIREHIHSMYVAISNDNCIEYMKFFILFKYCIRKQFSEEEINNLTESSKFNYYHKLMHKSFLIDLLAYEKSISESNQKRLHILVKIKDWYFNHLNDFDINSI
ncbi:MAG: hypothetical protein COA79_07750 [Planctomycetota bacterium]|nr:MAG: hypothetical protein COA79_07750 [Planctomycetota bacterium]